MSKSRSSVATSEQDTLPFLTEDHGAVFGRIRNYLAGRLVGATRDQSLLDEVLKILFSRSELVSSGKLPDGSGVDIARTYRKAFATVRSKYQGLFVQDDEILLDPESLRFVHEQVSRLEVGTSTRDPIGDLYEAFVGSVARGQEGQFFTPRNAISSLVEMVDPKPGERIIDPACGAGGFLAVAGLHMRSQHGDPLAIAASLHGIDKDHYLSNLARAHVALLLGADPRVFCADSLAWAPANGDAFALKDALGTFDVVLTNPPFGARIVAASRDTLRQFTLGRKWRYSRHENAMVGTEEIDEGVPPQVLFIERCLTLLRQGGRVGIVVPESLVSSKSYRHVVEFIEEHAEIRAVLGMPESLFKTSGKGGTHTKTCLLYLVKRGGERQKGRRKNSGSVFMAEAKWCGHDSRGRSIPHDDLPTIADRFRAFSAGRPLEPSALGYSVRAKDLSNSVLAPRYYDPEVAAMLDRLQSTHELVLVEDLLTSGALSITSGDEVGKLAYGTGPVPFVRTSDITNWEIKASPKHSLSREIFDSLRAKQDVRVGDILMVRDGTYLIGGCAIVTEHDTEMVYQSHILKIRSNKERRGIDPYLLLAILSSPVVQRQIQAKRFTQDIIDSIGDRIGEIVLPITNDAAKATRIAQMVRKAIEERVAARELAKAACAEVVS